MSDVPTTRVEGKYTDAVIFLPKEKIEDGAYNQVQQMINHPAFRNPVRVLSDMHQGAGAVIGFTMPLSNRVCPNTVGVDCGCGVYSFRLSNYGFDPKNEENLIEVDEQVREAVPMGREVHDWEDENYHMGRDFPYDAFAEKWRTFTTNHLDNDIDFGEYHPDEFEPNVEYFKDLCSKVHYNPSRGSNSTGSLGQGNHFIEFGLDSDGELWVTVHSGSRGLGMAIAKYHQERAERLRNLQESRDALRELPEEYLNYVKFDLTSVTDHDLLTWLQGGMGESFVDYEALKDEYAGTDDAGKIEEIGDSLKTAIPDHNGGQDDLAYLEGEEAVEYYVDLAFGQTYASENRKTMARLIAEALDATIVEEIESVHNYIDYEDGIIRKGATPAREGQDVIIPMNMAEGTFLARGKGNEEWNQSVAHGAGRVMSRTQAFEELNKEKHAEMMGETVATELPTDESPEAYKNVSLIREMIGPTVDIVDHLTPVLNLKAPE